MRSFIITSSYRLSLCAALAFAGFSCNDLLGPSEQEEAVLVSQAISCGSPCAYCSTVANGGTTSVNTYLRPKGYVCRVADGDCDVAETCDGSNETCPGDAVQPVNAVCRTKAAGTCDVEDKCDGTNKSCPDHKVANGTPCRPAADLCDAVELCNGVSNDCPIDIAAPKGQLCRNEVPGGCDVQEVCDGASKACPADVWQPSGTPCRAVQGVCDVAEACTGTSGSCPTDRFKAQGTECRAQAGVCDLTEVCTGASKDCPADAKQPSSRICQQPSCTSGIARPSIACDGTNAQCPTRANVTCAPAACDAAGIACLSPSAGGASSMGGAGPIGNGGNAIGNGGNTLLGSIGNAGNAGAQAIAGQSCTRDTDCPSGAPHCVDGVCCDSACSGQCEACDVAGSLGTCVPVPSSSQPRGSRTQCVSDGSLCSGACDGAHRNSCQYPVGSVTGLGTGKGVCDGTMATLPLACDGTGRLPSPKVISCEGLGCDANLEKCNGPCATDGNACPSTKYCSAGMCVAKAGVGTACATAAECASGFCTNGVCCSGTCNSACEICNAPGHLGTCTPVTGSTCGSAGASNGAGGASNSAQAGVGGRVSTPVTIHAAGTAQGNTGGDKDEGCSCRIAGPSRMGWISGALAALFGALTLRRRRRA